MLSDKFRSAGRRIYWARFVSFVGSAFTEFAIPLYLLKKSDNPLHVGLQWTLIALMRIVAGYAAPRIRLFSSDRRALIWLDSCLAIAALLPVVFVRSQGNVILGCYLTTLIVAFLSTIQGGYIDSLVGETSQFEKNREAARAWLLGKIENGRHLGMLLGYGLAYLVSSWMGFQAAFVIDSVSFALSAMLLSFVHVEGRTDRAIVHASYSILMRPHIRVLTLTQLLVGFGLFIYNAIHIAFLKQDLLASNAQLTCLYIFQYVGYFLGSRLPSRWVEVTGKPLSDLSTVLFRLSVVVIYLVFAFTRSANIFILTNTVFSFVIGASFPGAVALFQRAVAQNELRAAGAARVALTSFAGALGSATASILMGRVSYAWIFGLGAFLYLIAAGTLASYVRGSKTNS